MESTNQNIEDDLEFENIPRPKKTPEEIEEDINFFVNHPLNATKITP